MQGNFYLIYKTVLDLAGLFGLVGVALAVYRRYVVKPDRLNTDWRFNFTLPLLAYILITGLLVESLRLAATQPDWAPFSVVAYPISLLFVSVPESVLLGLHRGLWIFHFLGVGLLFATLPRTNLLHIFTSPANIFAAPFRVRGALHPIQDLEQAETLGVSKLTEYPLAEAGQRGCVHRVRALPGGLSGLCGEAAAEPQEAGAGPARRARPRRPGKRR